MNARMIKVAATLACVAAVTLSTDLHAQPRYETVHTFSGDRGHPVAALTEGPDGRLYGITRDGGSRGKGTVFVTDGGGTTTTLHEFDGSDGEAPYGRLLIAPDGLLYGTTSSSTDGFGGVFRLAPDGSGFQQVVQFTGDAGMIPRSGLVLGSDGALYGTTLVGGDASVGTIFRVTTAGDFSTLASFDGANGALPSGDLIATPDGLYGTTSEGGVGLGTVFHASLNGVITTLAVFDPADTNVVDIGLTPAGGVVLASDGNLYGTTSAGGAHGLGTIFGIIGGALQTLHSFSDTDGAAPTGALRELSDGSLYGTTSAGGASSVGTLFRFSLDRSFTSIASFDVSNGSFPASGVIEKASGAIFGTTEAGGPGLFGTVFELTPEPAIRTAASFSGAAVADPSGGVIQASDRNFYGIAFSGGAQGFGAVYRMTPDGAVAVLASFDSNEGLFPTGALMQASDGHLYGTTEGGASGDGGVFRVTLDGTLTTIGLFDFAKSGATPSGRLIEGSDGYLYGTTLFGANGGAGGVFRVNRAEESITESITAVATLPADETLGSLPAAGVVEAPDGSFYGTARFGGDAGFGTVFRVFGGAIDAVVSFRDVDGSAVDGSDPASPLVIGRDGNVYGTAMSGGEFGSGTLFRVSLDGSNALTTLVSFDGINGAFPFQQGVVETADGVFVGTTMFGGELGLGTAYQWSEASGIVVLHEFDGVSGVEPNATLAMAGDRGLYSTSFGPQGGTIYRLVSDKAEASLAVADATATYGGSTSLSATLTVSGAPLAGAEIAFSLNGSPVGSAPTDADGIATLADVSIASLDAGSYAVEASFAGTEDVQSAIATGTLHIARATPVVTVESATYVYDGQPHPATGTVTGLGGETLAPLTFTYNEGEAAPVDPGTYDVLASFAGSTNYEAASATGVITITPAPAGLNGLVAAYGFNEGGGSIAGDASGRGNFGRIRRAQWAAGRFGASLDFDGVNDFVTVQDADSLDIRNAITISAWVKPRSLGGWNTIVLKEAGSGLVYALYANDDAPQPAGYVKVGGIDRSVPGMAPLPLNEWTHVAMTYDGEAMRLFVNGERVARRSLTGRILTSNGLLRIGGNSIWGEFFDGLIDEVRIYARDLSAAEIRRDMNLPVVFEGVAPTVAITSPADGATVSGMPRVTVEASDNVGISSVQLQVGGVDFGGPDPMARYSRRLDLANGTYVVTAVARDLAGNVAVSNPVTITVASAPVASYDFDEYSGTLVVDGSGRGNNGTMNGGVTRRVDATRGRVLSFNGFSGLVSIADADSLDLTGGMTLEAWVRPTALSGWRTIVLKERGDGLAYALYANDDDPRPAGYVKVNGEDRAVPGETRLQLSVWTHVAVTYDGAMMRLFVNGVEVASREQTGAIDISARALRIGGNTVWGEWFRGDIDSVRVYDVAVGAAQISADMNR